MHIVYQTLRRSLVGIALLYCVGLVALALLLNRRDPQLWWLELLNIFALYLFTPLLFLIPVALLNRSWWLRGAVATAGVVFLTQFGTHLAPPPMSQPASNHLRVMTFNVLYSNPHIDDIIAAIGAQDADVVAIQELSVPIAAALQQHLSGAYPYQLLEPSHSAKGLGIISRYPFQPAARDATLRWQHIALNTGGEPIRLINVHLTPPRIETRALPLLDLDVIIHDYDTTERSLEIPELLRVIDTTTEPLIVLGDFNTSDRERAYAAFATRMHDAYDKAAWGFGLTFPGPSSVDPAPLPFPLIRIDYIWSKGGIVPAAAYTECDSGGSDHCLVVADLHIGAPVANAPDEFAVSSGRPDGILP